MCTDQNTNPDYTGMLIDSMGLEDGAEEPYLVFQPATEDDKVLECLDVDTRQIVYTKDHIPHAMPKLYYMHTFCFVFQLIALNWR